MLKFRNKGRKNRLKVKSAVKLARSAVNNAWHLWNLKRSYEKIYAALPNSLYCGHFMQISSRQRHVKHSNDRKTLQMVVQKYRTPSGFKNFSVSVETA